MGIQGSQGVERWTGHPGRMKITIDTSRESSEERGTEGLGIEREPNGHQGLVAVALEATAYARDVRHSLVVFDKALGKREEESLA